MRERHMRLGALVLLARTIIHSSSCHGASTSTDELDDIEHYYEWMNESWNLKEPHWTIDSMFLTGSDLSSIGNRAFRVTGNYNVEDSRLANDHVQVTPHDTIVKEAHQKTVHGGSLVSNEATKDIEASDLLLAVTKIEASHEQIDMTSESIVENTVPDNDLEINVIEDEGNNLDYPSVPTHIENATGTYNNDEFIATPGNSSTDSNDDSTMLDNSIGVQVADVAGDTTMLSEAHTGTFSTDTHTEKEEYIDTTVDGDVKNPNNILSEERGHDEAMDDSSIKLEFVADADVEIEETLAPNDEVNFRDTMESRPEDDSEFIDFDMIDEEDINAAKDVDHELVQTQTSQESKGDQGGLMDMDQIQDATVKESLSIGSAAMDNDQCMLIEDHEPKVGSFLDSLRSIEHDVIGRQCDSQLSPNTLDEMIDKVEANETELATADYSFAVEENSDESETLVGNSGQSNEKCQEILYGYTSIWGTKKHQTNSKVLHFMRFGAETSFGGSNSHFKEENHISAAITNTSTNPVRVVGSVQTSDNEERIPREETDQMKTVNDEFVEGLDDIDKLFEHVQPPDELDVGAAGSSMQEVLMGQGVQILRKRVYAGIEYLKEIFSRRLETKFSAFVPKDIIGSLRNRLAKACQRYVNMVRDVFADIMNFGNVDILSLDLREEESRLSSLRQAASKKVANTRSSVDAMSDKKVEAFIRQRLSEGNLLETL